MMKLTIAADQGGRGGVMKSEAVHFQNLVAGLFDVHRLLKSRAALDI
jgi:hypothetical protein